MSSLLGNRSTYYYDVAVVANHQPNQVQLFQQAKLQDIRRSPLVDNPSDYFFSIVRFTLPTTALPVLIFTPDITQSDPDVGAYRVTLADTSGNKITQAVVWEREVLSFHRGATVRPVQADPVTDETGYYYCMSYYHFVRLVNKALKNAMDQLIGLNPELTGVPPPFFQYNPGNGTFSLYATKDDYDTDNSPKVTFSCNSAFWPYFCNLPAMIDTRSIDQTYTYKILQSPTNDNVIRLFPSDPSGTEYIRVDQVGPGCLANWTPAKRILFTTTNAPVALSQATPPQIVGGDDFTSYDTNDYTSNVITDLAPTFTDGRDVLNYITYSPSGEYRLNDMITTAPFIRFDMYVWFSDGYKNYPLVLQPGLVVSAKIMIRSKAYNGL